MYTSPGPVCGIEINSDGSLGKQFYAVKGTTTGEVNWDDLVTELKLKDYTKFLDQVKGKTATHTPEFIGNPIIYRWSNDGKILTSSTTDSWGDPVETEHTFEKAQNDSKGIYSGGYTVTVTDATKGVVTIDKVDFPFTFN